jgi:hypothetical protein
MSALMLSAIDALAVGVASGSAESIKIPGGETAASPGCWRYDPQVGRQAVDKPSIAASPRRYPLPIFFVNMKYFTLAGG